LAEQQNELIGKYFFKTGGLHSPVGRLVVMRFQPEHGDIGEYVGLFMRADGDFTTEYMRDVRVDLKGEA